MPTKRQLVGSAFSEIGIGSWEFDLQPDEIQDAINRLDSMMALWSSQGIRIGYNSTSNDPDTESGVPDVALEAIRTNLALRLSPSFSRTPNPITQSTAASALSYLTALTLKIPQRQFPNTLPVGSGNRRYGNAGQAVFYPSQADPVAVGPDSILGLNP